MLKRVTTIYLMPKKIRFSFDFELLLHIQMLHKPLAMKHSDNFPDAT